MIDSAKARVKICVEDLKAFEGQRLMVQRYVAN